MGNFINERNGKFYSEVEHVFARRLYDYDYKKLLIQDEWEIYTAICYLAGFTVFDDETLFECQEAEMQQAFNRVNAFYPLVLESIREGRLQIRGDHSKYPSLNATFYINLKELHCHIKPYDLLKWAVENDILLLPYLQAQIGLFQHYKFSCAQVQTYPHFIGGNKFTNLSVTVKDRLTCQAIAQTLWFLQPEFNKSSIARLIKNDNFLNLLGNASKYIGKNTFSRWLKPIDPRVKSNCRGRIRKKPGSNKLIPLQEVLYWTDHFDLEHCVMPIYNFKKLKIIVVACALTLLHENNSLTLEEIIAHPMIQLYSVPEELSVYRLVCDWITDSLKK